MADSFEIDEELSEIINTLWENDENKCVAGEDYELDLQGYVTSTRNTRDWARTELFSKFDEAVIFGKDTFQAFRNLLDNYESNTDEPERFTRQEVEETHTFLDLVLQTKVMKLAHKFLHERNKAPEDLDEFKNLLGNIWFKLYKRTREDEHKNSCGFEHVFVGETRDRDVIGFHNWIQFYLQEKRENIDYKGYFKKGTADNEHPEIVTLQFTWKKGQKKPIGSSFIGTSPEFEMALYTICHLMGQHRRNNRVGIRVAQYEVEILCHGHGMGIGSAYPMSKM